MRRRGRDARSERDVFEYALLRVVPRVERGECFNAGVVLYCRHRVFLAARRICDETRCGRWTRPPTSRRCGRRLVAWSGAVRGRGPARRATPGERFRWLIAPRSTVVQPGPVHTGLTADPAAELERLLARLVRTPS